MCNVLFKILPFPDPKNLSYVKRTLSSRINCTTKKYLILFNASYTFGMRLNKSFATLTSFLGVCYSASYKSQGWEMSTIFVQFYKSTYVILDNFYGIRKIKARGNGNCAEISLTGHFMQIFSIFSNACSIKSIHISHNLA